MRLDRFQQEVEHRSALLRAGGDRGPGFALRAQRDPAVRPFRQVVRRIDARRRNGPEVGLPVLVEPFGQVLGVLAFRNVGGRCTKDLGASGLQPLGEPSLAELLAPVDHAERCPLRFTKTSVAGRPALERPLCLSARRPPRGETWGNRVWPLRARLLETQTALTSMFLVSFNDQVPQNGSETRERLPHLGGEFQ